MRQWRLRRDFGKSRVSSLCNESAPYPVPQRRALLPFVGWGALLIPTFGHRRSLFRYSDVSNSPEEDFTPFRWSEQAPFLSQQILALCVTHHVSRCPMDDPERDRLWRDSMKYNEFHKDGQKEDRTTAEIVEIATTLEDGARIFCTTFLWPNILLSITLDNRLYDLVRDVGLVVSNTYHYKFHFKRHDSRGMQRTGSGPWRNGFDMSITDVVECFGLNDQTIKNPDPATPGTWSGWFLLSYQGPRPDDPAR